jgi:hypothetical protein
MEMVTGEDDDFLSVDDVEKPVGKAAQHGAAHVSVYSLIEGRIVAEMLLYAMDLAQKFNAESVAFIFIVEEDCSNLGLGSQRVGNVRHAALRAPSACDGFRPK